MNDAQARLAKLTAYRGLHVTGEDAEKFLGNQLTSRVERGAGAGLSAWLNVKGRVIADFLLRPTAEGFLLLLDAELAGELVSALQRFVFRDKVRLALAEAGTVYGLAGEPGALLPEAERAAAGCLDAGPIAGAALPAGRAARWLLLDETGSLAERQNTEPQALASRWRRLDIEDGIVIVDPTLSAQYLPQNLNLDCLGGVSFDKGCYPGQEIVARVRYRGRVKQRLFTARIAGGRAENGARVRDAARDEAVGQILRAAPPEAGVQPVLLVMDVERSGAPLALETAPEARVELGELPYPVEL